MAKKSRPAAPKHPYYAPLGWTQRATGYVTYIQGLQSKYPNIPGNSAADLASVTKAAAQATAANTDLVTKKQAYEAADQLAKELNQAGNTTFEEKRGYAENYAQKNNIPSMVDGLQKFKVRYTKHKKGKGGEPKKT